MKTPIVAVVLSLAWAEPAVAGTFVYVSNAEDGDIGMYTLQADGSLQPGPRVTAAKIVMPMAISPDKRFLIAAVRSKPYVDPVWGQRLRAAPSQTTFKKCPPELRICSLRLAKQSCLLECEAQLAGSMPDGDGGSCPVNGSATPTWLLKHSRTSAGVLLTQTPETEHPAEFTKGVSREWYSNPDMVIQTSGPARYF